MTMTDLEMTRLCAQAMGYHVSPQPMTTPNNPGSALAAHINEGSVPTYYDPLHDDAQAMALVKKLRLHVCPSERVFDVWPLDDGLYHTDDEDLNRAIVTCVARMQKDNPVVMTPDPTILCDRCRALEELDEMA